MSGREQEVKAEDILREYDRESKTRIWQGAYGTVVNVLLAAFSLYCILMTLFSTALPEVKLSLFLALVVFSGYLTYPASGRSAKPNYMPWYDVVIMGLGMAAFIHFAASALPIIRMATRIGNTEIILGIIGILSVMELCRRCVGLPILCIVWALLIYVFINQFSYGASFYQALRTVIYKLFYSTSGIIGTPINVCFSYIMLFIIFGSFLEKTGISNFFIAFANRIAGSSSGGPAKVAVISSALCGMVSGSSVGNTVTTGSVTIPLMKETGYKPEFAGAVEAAASTGGQIMPPIMGAAAFLMAEYMNLPYSQVALKAVLPAVLYFAGIFIAVHLEAKKCGLKGLSEAELPKWNYLARNIYLILPFAYLIFLVSTGRNTMAVSAAKSILAAYGIGIIAFFVNNRKTCPNTAAALKATAKDAGSSALGALAAGARGTITVAVACAMAGMIAGSITVTGLASVLINAIVRISGNFTLIGLLLTMLSCIVLGMGVPTTANYCIMASTTAPILIQLGFSPVAAHFFVFYFGIIADITPPVALAAYAGSAIAKASPMKTGINATKLAVAAFIVPYIFVYNPEMLFIGNTTVLSVIQISVSALVGLFGVTAAINGYLFRNIPAVFRILLAASGLLMMVPGTVSDVTGLVLIAAICFILKRMSVKGR